MIMHSKMKPKLLIFSVFAIGITGCGLDGRMDGEPATGDVFAMDTYMELSAYGENGQAAVDAAIQEINRLDKLFSVGDSGSEVYQLNTSGTAVFSEESMGLLNRSIALWDDTDHAYDVAIYPVMDLWGFTTGEYMVPDDDKLKEALTLANPADIVIDEENSQVSFLQPDMAIDFGGIAKGYTSGRVMEVFQENGCESGIVSLGHNIQALGRKPSGEKWKVAILSPDTENFLGVVAVENKAVITSGGYERFFEQNDKKYHHIIDPATGYPAENGLTSVTIISEDGTLADALSTSIFIMGFEKGCQYWRKYQQDFDMVLCTDDGIVYITPGIESDFKSEQDFIVIGGK